jgi:hypothetical protein
MARGYPRHAERVRLYGEGVREIPELDTAMAKDRRRPRIGAIALELLAVNLHQAVDPVGLRHKLREQLERAQHSNSRRRRIS